MDYILKSSIMDSSWISRRPKRLLLSHYCSRPTTARVLGPLLNGDPLRSAPSEVRFSADCVTGFTQIIPEEVPTVHGYGWVMFMW